MKKFFSTLFGKESNITYKLNKEEIQNENAKALKALYILSFIICVVICVLYDVTKVFTVSKYYFLGFAVVFLIQILLIVFRVKKPQWLIDVDVVLFVVIAYLFAILIDNYLTNYNSRSLFLIFMVLFSVVFIEKPVVNLFTTFTFLTLFLGSSFAQKAKYEFILDTVYGVFIFLISALLNYLIVSARIRNIDINKKLGIKSSIDELSMLLNRRSFNEYYKRHESDFISTTKDISVIMFDIDFFKNYNDTYGHLRGDECIVSVAKVLKKFEQKHEIFVARYGGEEFVAVLQNKNLAETKKIAKEIVSEVKNLKIEHKTSPIGMVTISAGCASKLDNGIFGAINLINLADQNLYKAKIKGKNRAE